MQDWRFSAVRWLQQEHKEFEVLRHNIERLKTARGASEGFRHVDW